MDTHAYRYTVEAFDEAGSAVGSGLVSPDWYPAIEAARFQAVRAGRTDSGDLCGDVTPIWDAEAGTPFVAAVSASVGGASNEPETRVDIDALAFFRPLALAVGSALVAEGALEEGATFRYRVAAYPSAAAGASHSAGQDPGFRIEAVPTPSPVAGARPLSTYLRRSTAWGPDAPEDYPVFIPERVIEEAEALKGVGNENEAGGVLIGRLWRDSEEPHDVFAEVTALIPARHAVAQPTQLTFTADTWAAVDAAIRLRRRGEDYLGWMHSHPQRTWKCRDCPPEKRKECSMMRQFFSVDDVALHRAVFHKAYQIALVVGDRSDEAGGWATAFTLFGWSQGSIVHRGFHRLREPA